MQSQFDLQRKACAMLTFLQLLQALKSNLELVGCEKGSRVVDQLSPKKRDDRHGDWDQRKLYGYKEEVR